MINLAADSSARLYRFLRNTQRALRGNRLPADAVGPVGEGRAAEVGGLVSRAHETNLAIRVADFSDCVHADWNRTESQLGSVA